MTGAILYPTDRHGRVLCERVDAEHRVIDTAERCFYMQSSWSVIPWFRQLGAYLESISSRGATDLNPRYFLSPPPPSPPQ